MSIPCVQHITSRACSFTSLLIFSIVLLNLSGALTPIENSFAQTATPRLVYPIGDYRVGKRLMFEGLTPAASHSFETSYRLSRTINEQHGIDAVPSLCRNGQALYLAGDLPAALSNINAGCHSLMTQGIGQRTLIKCQLCFGQSVLEKGRLVGS